MNASKKAIQEAYDAAMAAFRTVSAEHRAVTLRYRAREIGDEEFLASRRLYNDAYALVDMAETNLHNPPKGSR